ncbi:MAG TPA: hypothetical protein VMA73_28390 [Streptosporangiaceae bacterium]|nr:hypothetical protein [Streptosporangiaceae bacterium]
MSLDAQALAASAGRPLEALTRRDVAHALLRTRAAEAGAALPEIRRQLIAAGNPLSAAFWDGTARTLRKIADTSATVGDVQNWLEATGTEPAKIIGMLVWDDMGERSELQTEIYDLLVAHLEELLAAGQTDPDALAAGDVAALREHRRRQEEWMMAPQPDGRVPMWTVLDESDEEFLAEWAEAEADALAELRDNLSELPERPVPAADLREASARLRAVLRDGQPQWPRDLLTACAGLGGAELPPDDAELWLQVAAGLVAPADELAGSQAADAGLAPDDLSDDEEAMVALCVLDHYDWLAVSTALARGGPGTPASADDLARFVSEYDPDEVDDQADAAAGMFLHVAGLWRVLGALDDDDMLTQLGWWGIPEAVQRAWESPERE